MMCNVAKAILCFTWPLLAATVRQSSTGSSVGGLEAGVRERPVMKIVRLLEDMKAELEKEKADDDAVNENLVCWCKKNDAEKTQAIEVGEAKIKDLKAAMGEYAGKIEELRQKLASTKTEIADLQQGLDEAVALRIKETKEFHGEEVDLLATVESLRQAILVLSKHHTDLVQLRAVANSLDALKNLPVAKDVLSRERMAAIKAFVQETKEASSLSSSLRRGLQPFFKSYTPQSSQIFAVLKEMKAEFEKDLSEAQKTELAKKQEYEELKIAKEEQLAAAKKSLAQLEQDDAEFREKNAAAYEEFNDTEEQLKIDQTFLANLKEKCASSDAEYAARTKSRLEEIAAVQETIAILNSDDSFEVFEKSVKTPDFFLQLSASTVSDKSDVRARLAKVLKKSGNPKLMMLAEAAKLDAFTEVKAAIDDMVKELGKQQKEEVDHRDWCIAELAQNDRTTQANYDKKASLEASIADLTSVIEQQTKEIEAKTKEIAETNAEMKKASEIREAANADFQEEALNQQITQAILKKAIDRMNQVYSEYKVTLLEEQQPGAPHIETSATHTDPGNGPARFTKYEQSASGKKIVAMLEKVMADSAKMEDEAMKDEEDSQSAYEEFMKDSNTAIKNLQKSVVNLTADKSRNQQALDVAKDDFDSTMKTLENLSGELGDLKNDCDFFLKNFEARQEARSMEMEALNEAKAILSGMKTS
mmetsp:Transcript_65547/g.125038  ORF Transcript_65547/g.125038 Transcript_65547/m.125038 type:complete len:703 (+) Transcript_65547:73-2181(+)